MHDDDDNNNCQHVGVGIATMSECRVMSGIPRKLGSVFVSRSGSYLPK